LLATKITGKKFVTTFHGTYNFNNSFKKFYNSIMVRSNLVIAGSNHIFSHINQNYSKYLSLKKRFLVIFRGINIDYYDQTTIIDSEENKLITDWNLKKDKKIILLPGRLTEWKGQELFIEAIKLVNKELGYEAFYAIILGSDQGRDIYTKKLKRLVEQYRLTNQVKFFKHCKNMPVAYKISDMVVSASIEPEAFGRISVEAQSMEKPIIASNIGGSNETIINNKTGFLFEAGNPEALSKKIIEVLNLDESTLKFMGIEGRKNVIKKFNVEKMCFSTYSEYKKLLN
jgi:glycosyltransferase involved in cell wall biosynthesis